MDVNKFGSMEDISGITFETLCFLLFLYGLVEYSNTLQVSLVIQSSIPLQKVICTYLYIITEMQEQ